MTGYDPLDPMASYDEAYGTPVANTPDDAQDHSPADPGRNGSNGRKAPARRTNSERSEHSGRPPRDLLAGLRDGAWLDAQTFPELSYHLPGIVAEGSSLLVGPPKIGKSWFVLSLALAAAAGGRSLGLQVAARPVLYLALEDGHRRLQDRCRTLLDDGRIPPAFEYLVMVEPGTVLVTIETWMARHPGAAPLVILDTLGKVMPPALMGESTYQRDYRVGSALKRLADEHPGSAVLTNHHDRKAGADDFVERVSGSHGLAGSADTIIVLARARHENVGLIEVVGRDVPEGEYAVSFDGSRGIWTLAGGTLTAATAAARERRATAGLDERSQAVVAYVSEHPGGVRAPQVAAALDLDVAQARQYLARLVESDRLARPTRGLYTPVASVALSRSDYSHATQPHDLWQERDNATDATPTQEDQ